jgi:hypothetical protein
MRPAVLVIAGLTLATGLPTVASAHHRPDHTGGGPTGPLTLTASPNPVVFGGTTVLSGRLSGSDRAGQAITLRSDPYPFGALVNAATATTASDGRYSFARLRPLVGTRYQARLGGILSGIVSVPVRIRVGLYANDYTPRAGSVVRFSGRACPEHDGAIVAIQRRGSDGRYRTVRRTRLVDSSRCSVYSRRVRVSRDGRFRVVVARDGDHASGISRSRVIDVH